MARVFIVEDEALIAMELADHLQQLGYEVCGRAAKADEALERIPAARPDVVLIDVNLGAGLSGLDVAERLGPSCGSAFIFLTAYSDPELVARAARTGSFAFLPKPFQIPVLAANIEMTLAARAWQARLLEANRQLDVSAEALQAKTNELERTHALLSAAFDASADGLVVIEAAGVRAANGRAREMWALPAEAGSDSALLTHIADQLVDPEAFVLTVEEVRLGRRTSQSSMVPLRDGRVFQAAFRPQVVDSAIVGCVVSFSDITERERAQDALLESEDRYRTLFEHAPVGLAVADARGELVAVNAALRGMGDATLDSSEAGTAPLVDGAIRELLRRAVGERAGVSSKEIAWTGDDGAVCHAVITLRPISLRREPAVLVMVEDVTERRRTEAALRVLSTGVVHRAGEEFFAEIARELGSLLDVDACVIGKIAETRGRVRTVGLWVDGQLRAPVDVELHGSPCETVINHDGAMLFANDAFARFPTVEVIRELGAHGLAAIALRDSRARPIGAITVLSRRALVHPSRVESMLRLFAVRTAAEMERQQEEHKFHDLFEFSPDATLMVNEAGLTVLANQQAARLFGYSRHELVGMPIEVLLPEEERERHVGLRRAFFANASKRFVGAHNFPLQGRRKDDSTFPADIGLAPLRSDQGVLMVAVIRDVSERLKSEQERSDLEAQLRHAQKIEAVGTLAGGIAHDFNNLLAAIVANLELARMDVEGQHPAIESLEAIAVAAERARQLVQQILAFSRRSPPQRAVVAPRMLVDETVRLLRATVPKGIAITTSIAEDVPDVFVDSTQIHQVLMNLGTNAWHAIDRGLGTIAIRVDGVSIAEGDATHGALPPGRYARFVVQDDGRGMAQETLDRIFEPFFTTKPVGRGSGLGLSVVHGIVSGHDGSVSVTSAPGAGTTVTVCLPESHASRADGVRHADSHPAGAGRVGFLDDESAMAAAARRLLSRLGYISTVYESPGELLNALRSDPGRFDVIVTDCNMPGMSGLDVAREVGRLRADLPVVLISGFSDRSEDDVWASGIHFRLDKPFTAQELDRVLRRALTQR